MCLRPNKRTSQSNEYKGKKQNKTKQDKLRYKSESRSWCFKEIEIFKLTMIYKVKIIILHVWLCPKGGTHVTCAEGQGQFVFGQGRWWEPQEDVF